MLKGMIDFMKGILLTSRSVTYAQHMRNVLERNGISAKIVRPDIELTRGNCAYAVNISQTFLPEAIEVLRTNRVPPVRVILIDNKGYKEIQI